jgi:hypothetical protein
LLSPIKECDLLAENRMGARRSCSDVVEEILAYDHPNLIIMMLVLQ